MRTVVIAVAIVVGIGIPFLAAGILLGLARGIQGTLQGLENLRRVAECKGEFGCEWVYHSDSELAGQPLHREHEFRYLRPFWQVPFLKRIKYDLVEQLPPLEVRRRSSE